MRLRTIIIVAGAVVVGLVVTAVAVISTLDFNQYRGLVAEKVKEATGRDLVIKGELKLQVGFSPALAVADVTFANAPWGTRPQMANIRRLEAEVALIPLIFGDLKVKRLVLVDADILLETDARGRGNWVFDAAPADKGRATPATPAPAADGAPLRLPTVHEVSIRNSTLVYRDGQSGEMTRLALARAILRADGAADPLKIDIAGTYNALGFQVVGTLGSIASLAGLGAPFPVDVQARLADAAAIKLRGMVREPLSLKGYEVALVADGAEIARVAALAGMKMAAAGPFKVEAKLADTMPDNRLFLSALKAELGKSDLVLVRVEGSIRDPLALKGFQLETSLEGSELGALSGLALPGMANPLPAVPALGPFRLAGRATSGTGDRLALQNLKLELGKPELLRLTASGAIRDILAAKGFDIDLTAEAPDIGTAAERAGVGVALRGPIRLQGKIADAGPDRYALSGLKLDMGGSDLSGEATLALGGTRPQITASLASAVLDLVKLKSSRRPARDTAAQAAPPTQPPGGSASAVDGDTVFSADSLPLDALQIVDADVRYRADLFRTGGTTVRNLSLAAVLRNGDLALRPLTAEIAGGKLAGEATLGGKTGAFVAKLDIRGVDAGILIKESSGEEIVRGGESDFQTDLRGAGTSMRALMAGLNGNLALTVREGTFKSEYADTFGFGELRQIIDRSLPQADTAQLNCFVGRFDIRNGVATSQALLFDTSRLTLTGSGTIDLGKERIGMLITPRTKVTSLLSLMPPIRVGGTLAHPTYLPDVATGLVQGVAGSAEGAAGAVAGVIGGLLGARNQAGDDSPCQRVLAGGPVQPPVQAAPAQPPQAQPGQAQPAQPKPADPIQGIGQGLRKLFGN
ncbi:MAG: AsmA family protein [Rhodospirillales bacterium]|nr:AsmA family protein [Rhodospirillales bacterium]